VLTVKDLFKQYTSSDGTPGGGVFNASFEIAEGELFTLLGPSGCGKTTTLRSIAGLERPQTGHIALAGRALFSSAERINVPMYDRDIGMVFQSYAIWPHMTVFENAAYPLTVGKAKMNKTEMTARVTEVLELVGLGEFARRPAPQLSGGQQQRLALARALTRSPALLLLDEPLSNLDALLREQMRQELKRLQKDTGVTAIYVTHDQSEALAISDRIAVMNNGLVEQLGPPREIYERPATEFVASFIGRTNLLRGKLAADIEAGTEAGVETPFGELLCSFPGAVSASPAIGVVIRPENIMISKAESSASAEADNRFEGRVVNETYLGEVVEYEVRVAANSAHQDFLVRARADMDVHVGDSVLLRFPVAKTLALIESMSARAGGR
jgi:iron(III) transport system ATP-binding protein